MKKAVIMERAFRRAGGPEVIQADRSIAIVCGKVSAIESGGRLSTTSDGGETDWCTIYLDSGAEILVCGTAERISHWLGIDSDI